VTQSRVLSLIFLGVAPFYRVLLELLLL